MRKNHKHQKKDFSSSPPNKESANTNHNVVVNGAHLIQTINLPRRTYGHSVTLSNKLIYIFGGCDETGNFSSSLFYLHPNSSKKSRSSGMTWTDLNNNQTNSPHTSISSRHFHSCVERDGVLWIFGGKSNGYHNDLWKCTLKSGEWSKIKAKNAPDSRYGHTAVDYENRMYIYGGYDHHGFICSDIYVFHYKTLSWNCLSYTVSTCPIDFSSPTSTHDPSSPTASTSSSSASNPTSNDESMLERYHHSCVLYNNKMVIFGGKTSKNKALNTIMMYDIDTNTISNVNTTGKVPSPRWGHIAVLAGKDNDCMFIYGGWGGGEVSIGGGGSSVGNDVTNNGNNSAEVGNNVGKEETPSSMDLIYECNLKTMVWRCITIDWNGNSTLGERYFHGAVYVKGEREMVIIGGKSISNDFCFNDLNRITVDINTNTTNQNGQYHGSSTAFSGVEAAGGEMESRESVNDVNNNVREIKLKVQYGDEIRLFVVAESILFTDLLSLLLDAYSEELNYTEPSNPSTFKISATTVPFRLVYRDEEGDMISIRSQSELNEAIKYYWKINNNNSGNGGTLNSFRINMVNKPLSGMSTAHVIVTGAAGNKDGGSGSGVTSTSPHNSLGSHMTPPPLDSLQQASDKKSGDKNKKKKPKKKKTSSKVKDSNSKDLGSNNMNNSNNNNNSREHNHHSPGFHPPSSSSHMTTMSPMSPPHGMNHKWTKSGNILGIGGFGAVYEAMLDTGESVAIKQLLIPGHQNNPDVMAKILAFQREIHTMQSLHHPNIVTYKGSDRIDDTLFIFMELVPGGSISSLLKKYKTLALLTIKNFTRQILLGVEYLHDSGFVHRDIKGPNVLVDSKGNIKLADFGASKQLDVITQTGTRTGTPFWMAPEVVRGNKYGKKADIYSLGCVVYEMVSGSGPPFSYLEPVAALFKIGSLKEEEFEAEVLSGLRGLGKEWDGWEEWVAEEGEGGKFLRRCIERDPKKRPDAKELLSEEFLKDSTNSTIKNEK